MLMYLMIATIIAISSPVLFLIYLQLSSPSPPITTSTTLKDRQAVVIKEIQPGNISGKVKITKSSQIWSATAEDNIEKGTIVNIHEVEGVHLKVERSDELEEEKGYQEELDEISQPVEDNIEMGEGLIELGRDITEFEACSNCETIITIPVEECPVCGEKLEKEEESKKKGFFGFFNKSLRI